MNEQDPHYHTHRIKKELSDLIEHLRKDVREVEDPQAQALFETTAETLGGLHEAFEHYERGQEPAWQES